jgi:F0F1-type ATP synthase gamma subunit
MITKRSLYQQSEELLDLRAFIEVYEEVAATRMQRIRSDVLKARDFLDGLTELFAEVKYNYDTQVGEIEAKSKMAKNRGRIYFC